jgi:hypothetical protein
MHPKLAQNSKTYKEKGFVVIRVVESNEVNKLKKILVRHISEKIFRKKIAASRINEHMYHLTNLVEKLHQKKMTAKNRHFKRMPAIIKGMIKKNVPKIEKIIDAKINSIWDEGYGSWGFRLIRPQSNDGYQWSCKAWGPAKKVVSLIVPIFGRNSNSLPQFAENSRDIRLKGCIIKSLHCSTEKRVNAGDLRKLKIACFKIKKGEGILFSPNCFHSENNENSDQSRLSLEIRFETK